MVGYLNAPQPFDKDGWINTQDKVIDEGNGYLRILGRKSEIINIGGEKGISSRGREYAFKT